MQVTLYVLGLVSSVVVSRALGPAGRGNYYLAVTAATICVTLVDLSLTVAHMYFFAGKRYSLAQMSQNATVTALILGPLAAGGLLLVFVLTRQTVFRAADWTDFLLVLAAVPMQLHQAWMIGFFVLSRQIAKSQLALLLGAIEATVASVIFYFAGGLSVHVVLVLYLASVCTSWTLHVIWGRRFVRIRGRVDVGALRVVVGYALKLHPSYLVWFLLLRFDTFLVSAYLGTAAVGTYSLAVTFAELVWLLTGPLSLAAVPFQSTVGIDEAVPLTFKTTRFVALLGLALSVGFAGTLWAVIPALYGAAFRGAYLAFAVLLPGVMAMAMERPLNNWLVRLGRPGLLAALSGGAFALNVALNIILLRPLGIAGASAASSVAYVALLGADLVWASRAARVRVREAVWPQREDVATVRRLVRRIDPRRRGTRFVP